MPGTILVIEDDAQLTTLLRTVLERSGFAVASAADGRGGLRHVHEHRPDAVILDVGLPGLDGWSVLDRLRDISDLPVLMLTGHARSTDVVRGLQAGADDYLTKPFEPAELQARLHALLRRAHPADRRSEAIVDGPLRIDVEGRTVRLDDEEIVMTPIEFRLLAALVEHRGQVLSRDQLLELAWSDTSGIAPERVKFSVHRLRRKLSWDGEDSPIEAVRGFGYRYRSRAAR